MNGRQVTTLTLGGRQRAGQSFHLAQYGRAVGRMSQLEQQQGVGFLAQLLVNSDESAHRVTGEQIGVDLFERILIQRLQNPLKAVGADRGSGGWGRLTPQGERCEQERSDGAGE